MNGPRLATDNEILGDEAEHHDLGGSFATWGMVGWDGDTDDTRGEIGDGTDGPQGRTLVHVTLFRGRDAGNGPPVAGKAQGRQIRAQIGWPLFVVPPLGMQVLVMFADGDTETPGNAVIVCGVTKSPTQQFRPDRASLDVGPNMRIAIKGQNVTLMDHGKDENPSRFACWLTVGPVAGGKPSISFNDPTGSGMTVSDGVVGVFATDKGSPPVSKCVLQLSKTKFGLVLDGGGMIKCDSSGNITVGCPGTLALPGGNVTVGALATALTPATIGPVGATAVGSTSVFISP